MLGPAIFIVTCTAAAFSAQWPITIFFNGLAVGVNLMILIRKWDES